MINLKNNKTLEERSLIQCKINEKFRENPIVLRSALIGFFKENTLLLKDIKTEFHSNTPLTNRLLFLELRQINLIDRLTESKETHLPLSAIHYKCVLCVNRLVFIVDESGLYLIPENNIDQ
jgi:RNase adaptor protein for sRNA GlmZ degradation